MGAVLPKRPRAGRVRKVKTMKPSGQASVIRVSASSDEAKRLSALSDPLTLETLDRQKYREMLRASGQPKSLPSLPVASYSSTEKRGGQPERAD